MKNQIYCFLLVLSFAAFCSSPAVARINILSTKISLSQEYDSNTYQNEGGDNVPVMTTTLAPSLTFDSTAEHNAINLKYAPIFTFDDHIDDYDDIHSLTLSGSMDFSPRVKGIFSDTFRFADEAPQEAVAGSLETRFIRAEYDIQAAVASILFPEIVYSPADYTYVLSELSARYSRAPLSTRRQVDLLLPEAASDVRRRHFTNDLSLGLEYEFARDSLASIGCRFNLLEERTSGFTERHGYNPYFSVGYRINPMWRVSLNYDYDTTDYHGDVSDEEGHNSEVGVDLTVNDQNSVDWNYSFSTMQYSGDRIDYLIHSSVLGWDHQFSPQMSLRLAVDGSYQNRDDPGSNQRDITITLQGTKSFEHSSLSLELDGGMGELKSAGKWRDLRKHWSLSGDLSHQFTRDTSASGNISYGRDMSWVSGRNISYDTDISLGQSALQEKTHYDDYEAGVSVTRTLGRWFSLSLSYTFHLLNTDSNVIDDYYSHLVSIQFSFAKVLWKD